MSSVAFLCGMPHGAAGPESGVEMPNLMTSAATAGPATVASTRSRAGTSASTMATRIRGREGCIRLSSGRVWGGIVARRDVVSRRASVVWGRQLDEQCGDTALHLREGHGIE